MHLYRIDSVVPKQGVAVETFMMYVRIVLNKLLEALAKNTNELLVAVS